VTKSLDILEDPHHPSVFLYCSGVQGYKLSASFLNQLAIILADLKQYFEGSGEAARGQLLVIV
jgi:hypothetical protein